MTRITGWVVGLAIAAVVAACGDSSETGAWVGGGPSGASYATSCAAYTTCGTCTPVIGCGWCFGASAPGGGQCASGPDQCAFSTDDMEFTWTWNSSGCPGVDASVGGPVRYDAGHDAGVSEASTTTPEAASTPAPVGGVRGAHYAATDEASTPPGDASSQQRRRRRAVD